MIQRNGNTLTKRVINTNKKNGWKQKTEKIKDDIGNDVNDLAGNEEATKIEIKKKTLS